MKPPFDPSILWLINTREGPAAVTAHCLMHQLRLVPVDEPKTDEERVDRIEIDGEWFVTEKWTRSAQRKKRKERQR